MANVKIPENGTLLTYEEMVKYMDAKFEEIKKMIASHPPVEPEKPKPDPEPEKPEGYRKPTIKNVTKEGDKKLSVLFDANKVFKMAAKVTLANSGNEVQIADIVSSKTGKSLLISKENTSEFAPDNNTPVLVLNSKLQPSPTKYNINFRSIEYKDASDYSFFFDEVVIPPPEPERPCKPPTGKIVRVELTSR